MISRSASFEFGLDAAAGTVVTPPAATCSSRWDNRLAPVAGDAGRPVVVREGLRGGFACGRGAGVVACPRAEPDRLGLARGVERLALGAGVGVVLRVTLDGVGFGLGGVTREGGGLSGAMGTGSGPAPTAGDATAAAATSATTHVRWTILWLVDFITASWR